MVRVLDERDAFKKFHFLNASLEPEMLREGGKEGKKDMNDNENARS
jgi:hypothetical protein